MGIPCKMNQDQNSMGFFCKVFVEKIKKERKKERKKKRKERKMKERKKD